MLIDRLASPGREHLTILSKAARLHITDSLPKFKRFKAFAHVDTALIANKKAALAIFSNIGLTAPTCGPLADLA